MTTRRNDKRATFTKSFVLKGLKGEHPPGTYSVETREERKGFFAFLKQKRSSTWIRISRAPGLSGVLKMVNIDAGNLANALAQDAQPSADAMVAEAPWKVAKKQSGTSAKPADGSDVMKPAPPIKD